MSNHPKGRSWPNKTGIATKQDAIMTPIETSKQIINHFSNQYKPYVIGKVGTGKKKVKLNDKIFWT